MSRRHLARGGQWMMGSGTSAAAMSQRHTLQPDGFDTVEAGEMTICAPPPRQGADGFAKCSLSRCVSNSSQSDGSVTAIHASM